MLLGGVFLFYCGSIPAPSFLHQLALLFPFVGFGIYLLLFNKKWLLYLALLFTPLSLPFALPGDMKLSAPTELIALLLMGVTFFYLLRNKVHRAFLNHPFTSILLIDLFWQIVCSIASTHPDVSFKRIVMRSIFLMVFYFLVGGWSFDAPRKNIRLFLLYAFGLIPVIYFTLMTHAHHDFNPRAAYNICSPYYNDHTIYGACLAFVLPLLIVLILHSKKLGFSLPLRIALTLTTIIVGTAEILALSRAAWLSLVVAVGFVFLLRLKVKITGVIVLLGILTITTFSMREILYEQIAETATVSNDGNVTNHLTSVTNIQTDVSNLERINRWYCAWNMFLDKPHMGFGPGTYQFEYATYQTPEYKTYISTTHGDRGNAHSEYLTYLSETGWPGIIVFFVLVFYSVHLGMMSYYHFRGIDRVVVLGILLGLITFYIHGLFNSFLDQDKMAVLVFAALSTLVVFDLKRKRQLNGVASE